MMIQDEPLPLEKPPKVLHSSTLQRKKLELLRKQRLAQALKDNLKKRKEQMRGRKTPQ